MWQQIAPAFRMMLVLTVLTGLLYPGVVTGLCQVFFHDQANGSLVTAGGRRPGVRAQVRHKLPDLPHDLSETDPLRRGVQAQRLPVPRQR